MTTKLQDAPTVNMSLGQYLTALGQVLRRQGEREVHPRQTGARVGSVALRAEGRRD